jgi:hypothetical protein
MGAKLGYFNFLRHPEPKLASLCYLAGQEKLLLGNFWGRVKSTALRRQKRN